MGHLSTPARVYLVSITALVGLATWWTAAGEELAVRRSQPPPRPRLTGCSVALWQRQGTRKPPAIRPDG